MHKIITRNIFTLMLQKNKNKMKIKYLILLVVIFTGFTLSAQYFTGQRVFSSKFPSEIKDYNQDTYLKIDNSCYECDDIIVAIENVYKNRVIQHAYIKKGSSYSFKNIPVGTYVCKYMWTDKFGNKHYQKDNSSMQYKEDEVGGYEITLEETEYGNMSQSTIDKDDFFE